MSRGASWVIAGALVWVAYSTGYEHLTGLGRWFFSMVGTNAIVIGLAVAVYDEVRPRFKERAKEQSSPHTLGDDL